MQSHNLDAGRAVAWYGFGWGIFMTNPVIWVVMMLLIAVMMLVLQIIPLVGPLVLSLILPALSGGLMYGAKQAAEGRPVEIAHLFMPLTDEHSRAPMLVLGAILLGFSLLLSIAAVVVVGGSVGVGVFGGGEMNDTAVAVGAMGVGMALMFLITLVFGLVTFAALAFAVPLVLFDSVAPTAAVKSSINASLKNVVPLVVFLVIYFVLAVIAAIPFFLGFLVLAPVTVAALYAGYRDIYKTNAGSDVIPA